MPLMQKDLLNLPDFGKHERRRMILRELESEHGFSIGKYVEIIFGHPFPSSFVVLGDYLENLVMINQLISSYDKGKVAIYVYDKTLL